MSSFLRSIPLLFSLGVLIYLWQAPSLNGLPEDLRGKFSSFASKVALIEEKAIPSLKKIEERVTAPKPLRVQSTPSEGLLTRQGVFIWTNEERRALGLSLLATNDTLHAVAKKKLDDMFARQYFEHVSPDGKGVGDLAKAASYDYVLIGENLALGDFKDDKDLVRAWMESPGHRANILKSGYTQIGIAVGEGFYEGTKVWIGVQTFGTPSSVCPVTSDILREEIEAKSELLEQMENLLLAKKQQIENTDSEDLTYNQKVDDYNALVREYNTLIGLVKEKVAKYNAQVKASNECRAKYSN